MSKRRRFRTFMLAAAAVPLFGLLGLAGFWVIRTSRAAAARRQLEPLVRRTARRHGVDPSLVLAVIRQESNFDADARGAAGEIGLMQITQNAAADWARAQRRSLGAENILFAPELNLEIGVWYLAKALRQFRHHRDREVLALSQYNAGRQRALRWAEEYRENLLKHIPIPSTRGYIVNVLKYRASYNREKAAEK